jgi:hypothetical protein
MGDIEFSDDEDEERKSKRGKKRRKERELKGVGKSMSRCMVTDSDDTAPWSRSRQRVPTSL